MIQLSENLYVYNDSCQVYVLKNADEAVLIDFGSGDILDRLTEIGVKRVAAVLMTHHHRDQGQGLARAVEENIPVWVPHNEQDLFAKVAAHWQSREIYNNYNVRQDRFSLLESIPIEGTLKDYETRVFGGYEFLVVPTPGHTTGSISLLIQLDGRLLAFTGDLIAGIGKLWSLEATQWTYNGGEGMPATVLSLLDLQDRGPEWLLPSHGQKIEHPTEAIEPLIARLRELMQYRRQNPRLFQLREKPFEEVTPHLLRSRASFSNYFVLLSQSGKALFFDFGYDFNIGTATGADRASRRPWLYTLGALKRQYGVNQVDTIVPTHFHDDHVAGLNLLRDNEGTQVWAADTFADVLRNPSHYDLPCIWYDPIPVDRELPTGTPIPWEEYELTLHPLPGHTLYAVAISLEVDGKRVLVGGDQYQGNEGLDYNYVYQNRFRITDYMDSAALYKSIKPDVILTGHWDPLWVQPGYFEELEKRGAALARLHRELLPMEEAVIGSDEYDIRITPYQSEISSGETLHMHVEISNPSLHDVLVEIKFALPDNWLAEPEAIELTIKANTTEKMAFKVIQSNHVIRRARIAADVKVNGIRLGQLAEALITIQ